MGSDGKERKKGKNIDGKMDFLCAPRRIPSFPFRPFHIVSKTIIVIIIIFLAFSLFIFCFLLHAFIVSSDLTHGVRGRR